MLKKILIPLDGSQLAERALGPGLQLAERSEAGLLMLRSLAVVQRLPVPTGYVLGDSGAWWPNEVDLEKQQEATRYLESVCARVISKKIPTRVNVRDGDAADSILDTAKSTTTDLIVMSSHGYSGITRWMLGSVAERVLQAAPCPVLVVRSPEPLRHILIPLDGSELSEQVLKPAFELAELLQCKVTLLRAIRPVTAAEVEDLENYERGFGRTFEEELHYEAAEYLRGIAQTHGPHVPEILTTVTHGSAAPCILDYADQHRVDVIAMSTHGRTGLQRWVYGSVTEKILHAANTCSMLVVRPEVKPLPET